VSLLVFLLIKKRKLILVFIFRPETKEELFNLRHSMAQNVVEQTFGTWKKRFPILVHPMQYSLETQENIVLALAVLHNMIINHHGQSEMFDNPNAHQGRGGGTPQGVP
jgi:hypothetical protein